MPDSVQSTANSSFYDPNAQPSCIDEGITAAPQGPPVVMLEPVVIKGDAAAQALIERHAAAQCRTDLGSAALACTSTLGSAILTGLTAPSGVGLAVGVGLTVANATNCARLVASYDNCVERADWLAAASAECEADGGIPVLNAKNDQLVCLER